MENTERNGGGISSIPKLDISFGHEAGGDFALPDYLPEIQRLVGAFPTVLPETEFLNGNVLELSGTVSYNIVYCTEEGRLASASVCGNYSADTALGQEVSGVGELIVDTQIESIGCRVTAPRGISIKCRLRSRILCDEQICESRDVVSPAGDVANDEMRETVERLNEDVESAIRFCGNVTDSVTGSIATPDGATAVTCFGGVEVILAIFSGGNAEVSGDVHVTLYYCDADGKVGCTRTKLPFSSSVPIGCEFEEARASAFGRVASLSLTPTDEGFEIFAEYDLTVMLSAECEMAVCLDAYSTGYEVENEMRDCEILRPVCIGNGRLTAVGEIPRKGEGETVFAEGTVSSLQITSVDGKVTVTGAVKVKTVSVFEGECFVSEGEIPIKYQPDCRGGVTGDIQGICDVTVLKISAFGKGSNDDVTCEVAFGYAVFEKQRKRSVTSVRLTEPAAGDGGAKITVYYPSVDESLWAVCKKYHADRCRILRVNSVENDILPGGKPVIID